MSIIPLIKFLAPSFFPNFCTRNSMPIISLENLFITSIIDNSVVTIIKVLKYSNIIMIIHFEKLEDYIDR